MYYRAADKLSKSCYFSSAYVNHHHMILQDKYGLDYTLIGIKKDAVAADYMKSVQPFDLTPTPVKEDDQLYVLQYPDDPDNPKLELSVSPCKKVIGKRPYVYNVHKLQLSGAYPMVSSN